VTSRLLSVFAIAVPAEILFDRPTVSELAEVVSNRLSESASALEQTVPTRIPRRSALGSCPLSFAQQRLWFLDQLEPGNPAYHIHAALRIGGPLDIASL